MTEQPITTRFIVLTAARSGSTALTRTLNSHPDVYCNGHPFFQNSKRIAAVRKEARAALDFTVRAQDPVKYAHNVLNFTTGPSVVGFKIWRGKDSGGLVAINALGPDPSIKKVILNRTNILACQSSEGLVRLKKQMPDAFENREDHPKLDFDPQAFVKLTEYRAGIFDHYCKVAQHDVLEIPYAGLMDTGIKAVAEFLGLSEFTFKALTTKRYTNDIIGRYKPEHHDEIKRTLDQLGHPEWVNEG